MSPLRAPSADGRSRSASPCPRPVRPDRDRARPRPPARRPARGASPALTRCASCHEPHDPSRPDAAPAAFRSPPSLLRQTLSSINSLIEDYLHPTRQDGGPGCDTSDHPGTRKRARGGGNAGVRLATPARRTSPKRGGVHRSAARVGLEHLLGVGYGTLPPVGRLLHASIIP